MLNAVNIDKTLLKYNYSTKLQNNYRFRPWLTKWIESKSQKQYLDHKKQPSQNEYLSHKCQHSSRQRGTFWDI